MMRAKLRVHASIVACQLAPLLNKAYILQAAGHVCGCCCARITSEAARTGLYLTRKKKTLRQKLYLRYKGFGSAGSSPSSSSSANCACGTSAV